MDLNQIVAKYEDSKGKKSKWDNVYNECFRYFLPQSDLNIFGGKPLYDSTGVIALDSFASNLKYSLLPPWRRWFEINSTDEREGSLDLDQQIEKKVTIPLFNALNHSNFDLEIAQSFLELGIGTAAIMVSEGSLERPLRFSSVSVADLVFEEDSFGSIETVYRKRSLTKTNILQLWPEARLKSNAPEIEILEATVFIEDQNYYEYQVIDLTNNELVFRSTFDVSPWIVFRWSKVAGEVFGRGPAINCLPDIKEANKLKELILQNAVLSVVPTYLVSNDGVINPHTIKIRPGGIIPVRSMQGSLPIAPLPRGADLSGGQQLLEAARNLVRQVMYMDRLGDPVGPVRSATELVLRSQQLSKDIGASFSRLQTELLEKLLRRCLYILNKKGITSPVQLDGKRFTTKFTSPLAKLQDQEELGALERILPLSDRFPEEFRLSLKTEKIPPWVARRSGLSANLLRTNEEKEAIAKLSQQQIIAQNLK